MCRSLTRGASKLSRTVSPSGTGPNSPSMPLSCRPLRGSARPTPAPMSSQAALSRPPRTGSDTTPTQNSPEQGGAASSLSVSSGRFGTETVQLLRLPARHKATAVPAASRPAAITAWVARWSGLLMLLAVAAQRAFAASLLELRRAAELGEGPEPELHELLAETRCSRLCPTPAALGAAM